ncbi:hypothetical protein NFI96_001705 [Prochilodus magdalenae]|nr:hypothetical protein NFI96_001705 [Prochilodus magdalenae]
MAMLNADVWSVSERESSGARASGVEAVHPLKLLQTREHSGTHHPGGDLQHLHTLLITDPAIPHANGSRVHGNRSLKSRPSKEVCQRDGAKDPPLVPMETSSTNHISTLTVESQGANQSIAKHNTNCSASTSQRTEWFLSTSQWQEFIPINIQDEEQPLSTAANQQSDGPTNQAIRKEEQNHSSQANLNKGSGRSCSDQSEMPDQNSTENHSSTIANQSPEPASIQPTVTPSANHVPCLTDQSGMELRIYEEIQFEDNGPKSPREDHGRAVGGVLSINHTTEPLGSSNYKPALEPGDAGTEEAETGSDVTSGTNTRQPVYSCVIKNPVTNHSVSFLKPRVTVVSTSL